MKATDSLQKYSRESNFAFTVCLVLEIWLSHTIYEIQKLLGKYKVSKLGKKVVYSNIRVDFYLILTNFMKTSMGPRLRISDLTAYNCHVNAWLIDGLR